MNKLNVLFWNIGKKNLSALINYYCIKYSVDILVLIEDNIPAKQLLTILNTHTNKYSLCAQNSRGISIYSIFQHKQFRVVITSSNFVLLVRLSTPIKDILFGAIHLKSKYGTPDKTVYSIANNLKSEIQLKETQEDCENTLLVGDFNMNPFEDGMVTHEGFNSVMCRDIANNTRLVSGFGTGGSQKHTYFYNPMWSFMGDLSKYRPGTFYWYDNKIANNYRWNTLDQILIRPKLIRNFEPNSLQVIDKDMSGALLIDSTKKTKSKFQICDHLPVFFTMDLTK